VACANQKGGSGKTTTVFNLGVALARRGRRVLLVDLDPQASLTLLTQVAVRPDARTVYHALVEDDAGLTSIVLPSGHGVDVLPATPRLERLLAVDALGGRCDTALRAPLGRLRGHYAHILVDCPPNLGALTRTALAAADRVLIPAPCDGMATLGLLRLLQLVRQYPTLQGRGAVQVLPSMFDARLSYAVRMRDRLAAHFGEQLLGVVVRRTVRLQEAAESCLPIADYDPRNDAAAAFASLAEVFDRD
jgi:chromosome partitioning protein